MKRSERRQDKDGQFEAEENPQHSACYIFCPAGVHKIDHSNDLGCARDFPCTMDHDCRLGVELFAWSLRLGLKVKVSITLQLTHLGLALSSSLNWSLTEFGLPRVKWVTVSL